MIPATYPTRTNAVTGRSEMVISVVPSINGLVKWIDYIPIKFVDGNTNIEAVTDNNGFMPVVEVNPTSLVSGIDYIPVYIDNDGVDAWAVEASGYIPVGYSGMGVPNAEIPFKLADSHLKALTGGTGTFARATTATVQDHEDVIREVLSGEIRYQGQRRVENLIDISEDFSVSPWNLAGTATVTGTNTLNFPDINGAVYGIDSLSFKAGTKYVYSIYLSGSGTISLRLARNGGGTYEHTTAQITLTSELKRYAVPHTFANDQAGAQLTVIRDTADTATEVTANFAMGQNKTGASDPTVPT